MGRRPLFGMAAISTVMGNKAVTTILKYKRKYPSMPIEKLEGEWIGDENELTEWLALFSKRQIPEMKGGKWSG